MTALNTVLNIPNIMSAASTSRGLAACPCPLSDSRVQMAMLAWGKWQWDNRDPDTPCGYPSKNPLALDWGLGRDEDYEPESMMPATVEIVHSLLMDIDYPEAAVFAWSNWAVPHGAGVAGTVRTAARILPYKVSRSNVELWLGVVSGAVMGSLGSIASVESSQ